MARFVGNYTYSDNYAYAGLYRFANPSAYQDYGILDPYLPFEENCLFRNFVFTPADMDENGNLTTGVGNDDNITLTRPLTYQFQTN